MDNFDVCMPQQTQELENQDVAAQSESAAAMPQAQSEKIRIKYNHEEREISLDEAAALAQKGLNYDKLKARYEQLRHTLEQGAPRAGENLAAADDAGDDIERELAEGRQAREKLEQIEREREIRARLERDIARLKAVFPDADAQNLPPQVLDLIREGESLVGAYALYSAARKAVENDAEARNRFNRERSTGSARFERGAELDEQALKAMSVDEIKRNFNQIMNSLRR